MKYVVFEYENTGLKMPVIFPDHVTHADVKINNAKPVSAGFALLGTEEVVTVTGDSESLGIAAANGDRELLIATLANAGMYAFMNNPF